MEEFGYPPKFPEETETQKEVETDSSDPLKKIKKVLVNVTYPLLLCVYDRLKVKY